ncbi:MAG: hypothetical protein ACKVWV_10575 [Planctomycetota bacterium]
MRKLLITAAIVVVLGASALAYLVYQLWNVPDGSDTPSTGWSAIGVGDVDADGCDDIALTMRFDPVTEDDVPTTWILSGRSGDPLFTVRADDSLLDARKFGTYGRGRNDARALGDWNGDGRADVGLQLGSRTKTHHSRTVIVSGPDGRVLLDSLPASAHWTSTMSAIGDVDRDGTVDVLVSTPGSWLDGVAARVAICAGADGGAIRSIQAEQRPRPSEGSPNAIENTGFGFALCASGDLDGDAVPDFVAGSFFTGQLEAFSSADGRRLWSTGYGRFLGRELRSIGDIDGDGTGDFMSSSRTQPDRIVSGRDGSSIVEIGKLRECVALGDVDGDGTLDFAGFRAFETARNAEPNEFVIASGTSFADLYVSQLSPHRSFAARDAGDVNADGVHDIAVTSNTLLVVDGRNWLPGFGTVTIRSGKDGSVLRTFDRDALVRLAARDFPRIVIR